jgi:hypothetical protein
MSRFLVASKDTLITFQKKEIKQTSQKIFLTGLFYSSEDKKDNIYRMYFFVFQLQFFKYK